MSEETTITNETPQVPILPDISDDLNVTEYYQSTAEYLLNQPDEMQSFDFDATNCLTCPQTTSTNVVNQFHAEIAQIQMQTVQNDACMDNGKTNEDAVRDVIKQLQIKHETEKIDLFCYVCNYGFKSFPRLIRHMETKKHAIQVEKFHNVNNNQRHCFNNGNSSGNKGTMTKSASNGCNHRQHQLHHHHPHLLHLHRHNRQTQSTQHYQYNHQMLQCRQYPSATTNYPQMQMIYQPTAVQHVNVLNDSDVLPEDVINRMIDSLGENSESQAETFTEIDTNNLTDILNLLN